MAPRGAKPKPLGMKRHRVPPVHESTTFPNVPNPNPQPLPSVRDLQDATRLERWPNATRRWWKAISTQPHTVVWSDSDWAYAAETAFVHARFSMGDMLKTMAELRLRNHQLGATWEGRRDLRIILTDAEGAEVREDTDPAVTAMADYREALA